MHGEFQHVRLLKVQSIHFSMLVYSMKITLQLYHNTCLLVSDDNGMSISSNDLNADANITQYFSETVNGGDSTMWYAFIYFF